MSKDAELQKITEALIALGPNLDSSDQKAVEKAQSELKKANADLKAWASKNGVTLTPHAEEGPETMRKCAPIKYPIINGKLHQCSLVGKDGRKCLYSCVAGTFQPT
jgi:hypothetical protein